MYRNILPKFPRAAGYDVTKRHERGHLFESLQRRIQYGVCEIINDKIQRQGKNIVYIYDIVL